MLFRCVIALVLAVALEMMLSVVWPIWKSSTHLLGEFVEAILGGVLLAVAAVGFTKRNLNYQIIVDDDCITAVHPTYKRTVRKNDVKTVTESDGSLLSAPSIRISKYGRFGTWFWGGIWIPKTLPEYESIRVLALNWKGHSEA
jgi:hypothetical protein